MLVQPALARSCQELILLLQLQVVVEPLVWNGTAPIPGESSSLELQRLAQRRTAAMHVFVPPRCRTPKPAHGCRSYRRGEEWIVCCFGNHSMKGGIALAPLLALLVLRAPPVEGHHLAQFAQFVRRDALCSQACSRQLKHEPELIETDHLSGTNGCERIEYRRKHRLMVASPVPVRLHSHGRHGFW